MIFSRNDQKTWRFFFLIMFLLSLGLIYLGVTKTHGFFNFVVFPFGLLLALKSFQKYRKTFLFVSTIDFQENKVVMTFLNGQTKEVDNALMGYSLLVQKFHEPLRAVELIEKGKLKLRRGKSIGKLKIAKWENLPSIAKYLIQNDFKSEKWKFGWGIGDILMLLAMFIGMSGDEDESYREKFARMDVAEGVSDTGGMFQDIRAEDLEQNRQKEEKLRGKYKK